MQPWHLITNFGDSAVMLPAALSIGLWLIAGGAWRATLVWLAAFGLGMVLVVATKVAFMGWGVGIASLNFTGISGHTMLSTSVTLTAVYLLSMGLPQAYRLGLMAIGLSIPLVIGVSRLVLNAHSPSEVLAGLVIGGLVAGTFAVATRRQPAPRLPPGIMVIGLAAICGLMHGHEAGAQGMIEHLSLYLSGHGVAYTRALYAGIA